MELSGLLPGLISGNGYIQVFVENIREFFAIKDRIQHIGQQKAVRVTPLSLMPQRSAAPRQIWHYG